MIRKVLYSFIVICVCIMHINANAADCPTGTETEPITQAACQAVSGCVYQVVNNVPLCAPCIDPGWYRDTTQTPYKCVKCNNGPDDQYGRACNATDSLCEYTETGGDENKCKWKMTCAPIGEGDNAWHAVVSTVYGFNNVSTCVWQLTCDNGTIFQPGNGTFENLGTCKTCDEITNDPGNYEPSQGTDSSYDVNWSPNQGYEYPSDNFCTGKIYTISFNIGDIDTARTQQPIPRHIYEKYNDGFYMDEYGTTEFTSKKVTPLRATNEFLGYFTNVHDGDMVFNKNGTMQSAYTDPTFFKNATTLYAHWGEEILNYKLSLKNGSNYPVKLDIMCNGTVCEMEDINGDNGFTCSAGFYIVDGRTINLDVGTITRTGTSVKFFINGTGLAQAIEEPGITFTLDISGLTAECPADNYCPDCDKHRCPLSSTTGGETNKTRISDCFWNQNTVFKDNTGGAFTLPIGEGGTIPVNITVLSN